MKIKVKRKEPVVRFNDIGGGSVFQFCDDQVITTRGVFQPADNMFIKGQNRNITILLRNGEIWEGIQPHTLTRIVRGTFVEDE